MKYAIIEQKEYDETYIKSIANVNELLDYAKEQSDNYAKKNNVQLKILEGFNSNEIKINKTFSNGYYLLLNPASRKAEFIQKDNITMHGTLYNSVIPQIISIMSWKMILKQPKNIINVNNIQQKEITCDSLSNSLSCCSSDLDNDFNNDILKLKNNQFRQFDIKSIHDPKSTFYGSLHFIMGDVTSNTTELMIDILNQYTGLIRKNTICIVDTYRSLPLDKLEDFFNITYVHIDDIKCYHLNSECTNVILYNINEKRFKTPLIKDLLMNAKYGKRNIIILFLQPVSLAPEMRYNLDYIYLFRSESLTEYQTYYRYAQIFPTHEEFKDFFNKEVDNQNCMVISQRFSFQTIYDSVFKYRPILSIS